MTSTLDKVLGKVTDYMLCNNCKNINWYEREFCRECNASNFDTREESVREYILNDYAFYKNEGYTEAEVDLIEIDV